MCFHTYAASDAWHLEAAVLAGTNRSFDLRPSVIGIFQHRSLQMDIISGSVETLNS